MATHNYYDRGTVSFWRQLGFDENAARAAAECFPEHWFSEYKKNPQSLHRLNPWIPKEEEQAEKRALATASNAPLEYSTDARHPAFWLTQDCDFDEAIKKAVVAIAMVKLQREANPPPPPPQRDNFAEVAQALLLQGSVQPRLEGPGSHGGQCNGVSPSQEPFDPNDYPRFRAAGS